jgi:hypothetical protein
MGPPRSGHTLPPSYPPSPIRVCVLTASVVPSHSRACSPLDALVVPLAAGATTREAPREEDSTAIRDLTSAHPWTVIRRALLRCRLLRRPVRQITTAPDCPNATSRKHLASMAGDRGAREASKTYRLVWH